MPPAPAPVSVRTGELLSACSVRCAVVCECLAVQHALQQSVCAQVSKTAAASCCCQHVTVLCHAAVLWNTMALRQSACAQVSNTSAAAAAASMLCVRLLSVCWVCAIQHAHASHCYSSSCCCHSMLCVWWCCSVPESCHTPCPSQSACAQVLVTH
jgi:hypothetical protein